MPAARASSRLIKGAAAGLTAASVVVSALSIAGCGGSGDAGSAASEPTRSSAPVSASPASRGGEAGEKSLGQVQSDLRSAAGPYGDLRVQDRPPGMCALHATVATREVLDVTAMEEVVARPRTRGWTPDGPVEPVSGNKADGNLTYVTSGEWRILLGAASVTPEVREAYAPNEGVIVIGVTRPCKGSATPRPSPTAKPPSWPTDG